jgi:hypothetical protein
MSAKTTTEEKLATFVFATDKIERSIEELRAENAELRAENADARRRMETLESLPLLRSLIEDQQSKARMVAAAAAQVEREASQAEREHATLLARVAEFPRVRVQISPAALGRRTSAIETDYLRLEKNGGHVVSQETFEQLLRRDSTLKQLFAAGDIVCTPLAPDEAYRSERDAVRSYGHEALAQRVARELGRLGIRDQGTRATTVTESVVA